MAESRMIQAGDRNLEVWVDGPEDAEQTVVLVHGTNSSGRIWVEMQRHLAAAGARSYAINMVGAGRSDQPAEPEAYQPSRYAADLSAAIKALGIKQYLLVSHALGGRIASRFLCEQDRSGCVGFAFMSSAHMMVEMAANGGPGGGGGRAQQSAAERYREYEESHYGLTDEQRRLLWADIEANPPQRAVGQRMEAQPNHVPLLAELNLPILCMTGDNDGPRTELTLKTYLGLKPQYRYLHVIHGNVSHYPNAQVPDQIAPILLQFMRKVAPVGAAV